MNTFVQAMPPARAAAAPPLCRTLQISCQDHALRRLSCMCSIGAYSPSPDKRLYELPFVPVGDEAIRVGLRSSRVHPEYLGDKAAGCVQRGGSR